MERGTGTKNDSRDALSSSKAILAIGQAEKGELEWLEQKNVVP